MTKRAADEAGTTARRDKVEGSEPTGVGNLEDGPATDTVGSSLDHLIGSWSDAEAHEVERALKHFEINDEQTDLVSGDATSSTWTGLPGFAFRESVGRG